ncbi:MAG: M20/M25/M40 family metallo-hydrolase [Eubacteriales bacterium]|nr:M20/M25/M40 family metallo-hydrolase [Eubacteriales bacterium]
MGNLRNIDEESIKKEFSELAAIDSVSFSERQLADCLTEKLRILGFAVTEDEAGKNYGGNAGNLYGFLKGTLPGAPVLLSAHMDTVQPGIGKKAVFTEDGRITSQGDTVLGADDLAGIVEILEAVRFLQRNQIPHRDVEVLFPIGEEVYVKGTNVFAFEKIRAKEAYVLDMSGKVGRAAIQAPSIVSFEAKIQGRAAHAGFEPQRGIHAISVMSKAIAEFLQGRRDGDLTFNIGTISGGEAVNIVPEICRCTGEIRGYDHRAVMACVEQTRENFMKHAHKAEAHCTFDYSINAVAYQIDKNASVVKRFEQSCKALGIKPELITTFGGSDNNNFVLHGIQGIVLSCGMFQVHSTKEYALVEELKKGAALVAELMK